MVRGYNLILNDKQYIQSSHPCYGKLKHGLLSYSAIAPILFGLRPGIAFETSLNDMAKNGNVFPGRKIIADKLNCINNITRFTPTKTCLVKPGLRK